jgi:hypothetical protein
VQNQTARADRVVELSLGDVDVALASVSRRRDPTAREDEPGSGEPSAGGLDQRVLADAAGADNENERPRRDAVPRRLVSPYEFPPSNYTTAEAVSS